MGDSNSVREVDSNRVREVGSNPRACCFDGIIWNRTPVRIHLLSWSSPPLEKIRFRPRQDRGRVPACPLSYCYHRYCDYNYCYENDDGNGPWESFSSRQEYYYWNHSEGPDPMDGSHLYGGWENISIEISLLLDPYWHSNSCYDLNGNWISSGCWVDRGDRSVWPTSEYEFTLYYRFVPVIPVD